MCQYCSSNSWAIPSFGYRVYNIYSPETHELVEKKDAKIKRVKEKLESLNFDLEYNNTMFKQYGELTIQRNTIITNCKENIKKLEQELKELES